MQRIAIVGTTGSGKTTLARTVAGALHVRHVELDALHWGAGWTAADREAFRRATELALAGDRWVVDGNYKKVRDIIWSRADTVVWLDYSVGTILRRLFVRSLRRSFGHEELWNGNRETFRTQFLSRDSLFLWVFRTHWRYRATYATLLGAPEHAHLQAVRLEGPAQAEAWLRSVRLQARPEPVAGQRPRASAAASANDA